MPGNAGDHAARAKKAKATEAEGSAAAAALKVVKAQARTDAAAEKKAADAARKVGMWRRPIRRRYHDQKDWSPPTSSRLFLRRPMPLKGI